MNEDQLYDAAEREMDLYRAEITRITAASEAAIASLTDQRNRVSDTADRLRAQARYLRDALERCRDAADRSPAAVHTITSQALASNPAEPTPAPELAAMARPRVDWARVSEAVADRERERDEARAEVADLRRQLSERDLAVLALTARSEALHRQVHEMAACFHGTGSGDWTGTVPRDVVDNWLARAEWTPDHPAGASRG